MQAQVAATGGEYQFAAVRHAPGKGPPQGTNAGAVGAETAKYVTLPPTGLAALSVGQSDIQLNYLPVSLATTLDVTKNLELENPVNLMTGSFDIAFVVIFLLPIFILAMSYDLLSSEKGARHSRDDPRAPDLDQGAHGVENHFPRRRHARRRNEVSA